MEIQANKRLTPEQRFFISWATVWRTKSRDEATKPSENRSAFSGMYRSMFLYNIDFYEAFDSKGDGMYIEPVKRVRIW
jgi:endothelin-converting enzyme/putative endopeptidase